MENNSKKNVLIFIPEFPGLSETFIEREVAKLVEWGNMNIQVYSLKRGAGATSEKVIEKIRYHRLNISNLLFLPVFLLFRLGKVREAYKLVKINPNRKFMGNLFLFIKALGYARLFKSFKPDVIYANFMSEPSTICLIASEVLGTDFAISAHAKDVLVTEHTKVDENAELVANKVKKAKFVSICNKYAYEAALRQSDKEDHKKVHLIYHGLDFKSIENFKSGDLEKPDVSMIFTNGRFVEKKGHKYLIEASRILKDRGFSHVVYLLGAPGSYYQETVDYIEKLDVVSTVKVIGEGEGLPFEKVVAYYRIADVFAYPSINTEIGDADGIANTLIEACAFRLPIVTTDAGSISELIKNEETGLVVPQENSYELANALEKLIVDKEYAANLANNAYEKAVSMFDINRNVGEVQRLLIS
ncbi:glycosyltransferase family 4 protein [Patescibacteria group bacterium]|nr:glycosyltransferase family 4 protein [Patescibacteria group bacterium]